MPIGKKTRHKEKPRYFKDILNEMGELVTETVNEQIKVKINKKIAKQIYDALFEEARVMVQIKGDQIKTQLLFGYGSSGPTFSYSIDEMFDEYMEDRQLYEHRGVEPYFDASDRPAYQEMADRLRRIADLIEIRIYHGKRLDGEA